MINIKGLDKAEVLVALWKGSHCQGISFLGMMNGGLTLEKAKDMIRQCQIHAFERSGEAPDLTNSAENTKEYTEKFETWLKTDPDIQLYFDYVEGHVIKCDISGDEFDERLYDRDCGEGKAEKVIEALRNGEECDDNEDAELDFFKCLMKAFAGADREKSSERHDPTKPVHMVGHADILHEEAIDVESDIIDAEVETE